MANRTYHPRLVLVDGYRVRDHPIYVVWADMLSRCENPKNSAFENYGARGIRVCPRWYHFRNFAADMGIPKAGLTIERVDNSKGYEPGNCRWATKKEQQRNRNQGAIRHADPCGDIETPGVEALAVKEAQQAPRHHGQHAQPKWDFVHEGFLGGC